MSSFISGIDTLSAIGPNINMINMNKNKINNKAGADKEFVSIFVSQILKEVFENQSSMFGEEKEEGALGDFSKNLYNDIMMAKISSEIAQNKAFGFDKLMMGRK
jgi:Rod binding domain-containing protein